MEEPEALEEMMDEDSSEFVWSWFYCWVVVKLKLKFVRSGGRNREKEKHHQQVFLRENVSSIIFRVEINTKNFQIKVEAITWLDFGLVKDTIIIF